MYGTRDGEVAEVAIVGNEGVVGISSFMGGGLRPAERSCNVRARSYEFPPAS